MFFSYNLRKIFRAVFLCVFLVLGAAAFARPGADRTVQPSGEKVIVASTSWVAAIAEAAGAANVRVLAPAELRHPPEYELRPSDLVLISQADFVLYAGWERFAQKLVETAGSGAVLVQVDATNVPHVLIGEAEKLALLFGTEERFRVWQAEFNLLAQDIRARVNEAYTDKRVVVQRMQTPFIQWLGFDVVGEYGPAEPSPALILELARLSPTLVADNYHGPSGIPIAETAGAPYAELINFPGRDGTKTLADVFRYNAEVLLNVSR